MTRPPARAIEGHVGGARRRRDGQARVGRCQSRGHVGDHVVLDIAVIVDVGRAAGEGGAGEALHGDAVFVDDAEGIDELGQACWP